MKRSPLRKQSLKRKAESVIYRRLRKEFLEDHPRCQWPTCRNRSEDVHHTLLRGKHFLDVDSFRALCRRCHDFLHQNSRLARKFGWLPPL